MNNENKIILDLCGGTGSWSRPYKEAGYDVRLITLPDKRLSKAKAQLSLIPAMEQIGIEETI